MGWWGWFWEVFTNTGKHCSSYGVVGLVLGCFLRIPVITVVVMGWWGWFWDVFTNTGNHCSRYGVVGLVLGGFYEYR